jgi:hypothetical protein
MNETYEKICTYINWSDKTDTDTIKLNLMHNFTKEQINEADEYATGLMGKLRKAGIEDEVAEYNGYYGDSVYDFMCHMVSKGEAFVDELLESRSKALEIFKAGDYTENFFYCFPDEGDYQLLTAKHYWQLVSEMKAFLRNITNPNVNFQDEDTFPVRSYVGGREVLPKINHEAVKYAAELLEEIWHLKWNSNRDYSTIYKITGDMGHDAWFANLWSDMGKFFVKARPECVIGDGKYRKNPEKV